MFLKHDDHQTLRLHPSRCFSTHAMKLQWNVIHWIFQYIYYLEITFLEPAIESIIIVIWLSKGQEQEGCSAAASC